MVRFSTAGVNNYDGCSGNDLEHCIEQADAIRAVYEYAGFQGFTHWRNGDVWGSDFRDASNGDLASNMAFSSSSSVINTVPTTSFSRLWKRTLSISISFFDLISGSRFFITYDILHELKYEYQSMQYYLVFMRDFYYLIIFRTSVGSRTNRGSNIPQLVNKR